MIVAVQDANILIDLLDAGLLPACARLEFEFHTADLVLNEVRSDRTDRGALDAFIADGHLRVRPLSSAELGQVLMLNAEQGVALSIQDCSALWLSRDLGAILLTGDGTLRKRARGLGIDTHGVLWLLDELVKASVVTPVRAIDRLRFLMEINARLPEDACLAFIARWESDVG